MTEEEQKKTFGKNLSYYVAQSGKEQKQIAKEFKPLDFTAFAVGRGIFLWSGIGLYRKKWKCSICAPLRAIRILKCAVFVQ